MMQSLLAKLPLFSYRQSATTLEHESEKATPTTTPHWRYHPPPYRRPHWKGLEPHSSEGWPINNVYSFHIYIFLICISSYRRQPLIVVLLLPLLIYGGRSTSPGITSPNVTEERKKIWQLWRCRRQGAISLHSKIAWFTEKYLLCYTEKFKVIHETLEYVTDIL